MAASEPESPRYSVQCSGAIAKVLKRLQRQASGQGRGEAFLAAFRQVVARLQIDPSEVGEPLYRLPALRMQVRTVVNRPLVLDFAVFEDSPVVFIKGVELLSQ